MNKAEMRGSMQRFLAALGADELAARSAEIARRLQETAAWAWMDVLLSFLSMPREIETNRMIRAAHARDKSVAVPRIEGGEIRFLMMPADARTPPRDRWGIPVPDPSWPVLEPARAGRMLVAAPGLAFDRKGNRLGRGKGYYDRFLSRARVDGVVTENETLLFDSCEPLIR
ncbi:MAG: 5-formyltetrahydrofolate cyclo-ligase [Spirochaetia bacterium]